MSRDLNTLKKIADIKDYAKEVKAPETIFDGLKGVQEYRQALYQFLHADKKDFANMVSIKNMEPALEAAHLLCNPERISEKDATYAHVSDRAFADYTRNMAKLDECVEKYYLLTTIGDVAHMSDTERNQRELAIASALEEVWASWKHFLGLDVIMPLCENVWYERRDVEKLVGYISSFVGIKKVGTQYGRVGEDEFARRVESLIGLRMAIGTFVTSDDRKIIEKYESALDAIKNYTGKLEGSKNSKGEHIPSYAEQIESHQKSIDKMRAMLIDAGVTSEEIIANATVADRIAIKDLKANSEQAEKALARAKQTKFELEPRYDALIDKIKAFDVLANK